jgi:predicted NAD-dependent protein-ADP-ribosyltransferase YbiA (DUF1768 family)
MTIFERALGSARAHGGAACVDVRRATVRRRDDGLNLELAPEHPCGGAGAISVDLDLEDAQAVRDVLDEGIAARPGLRLRCPFCLADVPCPPGAVALVGELQDVLLRCDRFEKRHDLWLPFSWQSDNPLRLLSTWAHTPFTVRGINAASVEGLFRGLRFPEGSEERKRCFAAAERDLIAVLATAKRKLLLDTPVLEGQELHQRGGPYYDLIREALTEKFYRHEDALAVLLATEGFVLDPTDDTVLDPYDVRTCLSAVRRQLGNR